MPGKNLLLWAVANPTAMKDDYLGVYLTNQDMVDFVSQIDDAKRKGETIPVLIEHTGSGIGNIVSAWISDQKLHCCLEVESQTLESSIGQELVKQGITGEVSLGYHLEIQQSADGKSRSARKFLKEISLVKKGARQGCLIMGTTKH